MCVRTLKRRLKSLGLRRKGNGKLIDDSKLRQAIREEMNGPGSLSGYRSICHALRLRHHIHVMRNLGHEKKSQHVLITSVILRQSFLSAMKRIISTRTVGMCPCSYF